MSNTRPEMNINYEVYLDGARIGDSTDIAHPNFNAITAEIKGAGIMGSIEEVVQGHFQALSGTINFRTVTSDTKKLLKQQGLHLEFWGAVQVVDPGTGEYKPVQHKIIWRAKPKNNTTGNFNVGDLQGRALEFSITYYREFYDNEQVIEFDPLNGKYIVGTENLLDTFNRVVGLT